MREMFLCHKRRKVKINWWRTQKNNEQLEKNKEQLRADKEEKQEEIQLSRRKDKFQD